MVRKAIRAEDFSGRRQDEFINSPLLMPQNSPRPAACPETFSPKDYGLNDITYTVAETLKILSIGRNTFYKLRNSGELTTMQIYGRRIVSAIEIARFLNSAQKKAG